MKKLILVATLVSLTWTNHAQAAGGVTVTVNGQSAGPTPFISQLDLTISDASALKSVEFIVEPKPNSVTRPVAASYSSAYLQSRGFLNLNTGQLTLPVFGLYANFSNTVALTCAFKKGPAHRETLTIPTAVFADPTGVYTNPTVLQARSTRTDLSYDFILLKGYYAAISPIIIDTDGEVRWVGAAGLATPSVILFKNSFYLSSGTGVTRMEFDGTSESVADYADLEVTSTSHHNFDPGKQGILIEVNTTNSTESVIMEIDTAGTVLKTWRMAEIVRAAMLAGGDDPTAFVRDADDWFHNNSCTYRKADDTLLISSRENFVIALDYETGAIQWILGDPTKAWHQYASLRQFALTVPAGSLPPIGEHALSITKDKSLLLFDNGANSLEHTPAGDNRDYSAARKYRINTKKKTATEIWNYQADPSIYSPYCSSVYEDRSRNYLIDYTLAGPFVSSEIIGLSAKGEKVFGYSYPALNFCAAAWNAIPVHLENVVYP